MIESFADYGVKAKKVVCGHRHTLILTEDGEVLSFGDGEYGVLGTGNLEESTEPTTVEALLDYKVIDVAAGSSHSLVLTDDNRVFAWGKNNYGQLGMSDTYMDTFSFELYPSKIHDGTIEGKHIKFIKAAARRSVALTEDGSLFLWGQGGMHIATLQQIQHEIDEVCEEADVEGGKIVDVVVGGQKGVATAVLLDSGTLLTWGDVKTGLLGRSVSKVSDMGKQRPELVGDFSGPDKRPKVVGIYGGPGQHMAAIAEFV
jgi:alpha-tubulin suppressor-like RCC1 family protein